MKKLLSIVLCVVMIFAFCIPTYAATKPTDEANRYEPCPMCQFGRMTGPHTTQTPETYVTACTHDEGGYDLVVILHVRTFMSCNQCSYENVLDEHVDVTVTHC